MIPQPPPGQGPIDPREAFAPPPPPNAPMAPGMLPQQQQQQSGPPPFPPGMRPPQYPPPFYPPPPPPRRGGIGRWITFFTLLFLLGLSVLINIALFAQRGGDFGTTQRTLVEGDPKTIVAVAPLEGLIDDSLREKFSRVLDRIEKESDVKALVVRVDSPGGAVNAADEIYHRIEKFKADKPNIPVVISMGGLAASGGYYASCAGDRIYAEPTTLTADIGVIFPSFNLSKLMDKYGIQDATIISTGATYKDSGSMFRPEKPQDRIYLQGLIDSAFARFKDVVAQGRGKALKPGISDVANGRAYTAQEAVDNGLVDKIGYLEDATADAASSAHISNPTVIRYEEKQSLLDLLSGGDAKSALPPRSADGVTLSVDAKSMVNLLSPRPLYLWMP